MSRLKIRQRIKQRLSIVSADPAPVRSTASSASPEAEVPPMPEPELPPLVGSEAASAEDLPGMLTDEIAANPAIIYMKGSRYAPQCGFSARVVEIFEQIGSEFQTRDCLSSEALRSGIKDFSSWPTIPQIYLGGEFVGGCDIIVEMHQSGELAQKVAELTASAGEGA